MPKERSTEKRHDLLTESDFTRIASPKKKHHTQLPDELTFDDENEINLEETLIGMEYDLDPGEDDWSEEEVNLEKMDQDETLPNEPRHVTP